MNYAIIFLLTYVLFVFLSIISLKLLRDDAFFLFCVIPGVNILLPILVFWHLATYKLVSRFSKNVIEPLKDWINK